MAFSSSAENRPPRPPLPSPEEIRELPPDGGDAFNRLVFEKSPYLLQHARNPVDWYPWGPEAFEAAEKQEKPILLSVGYATCHWCHVMEHESFEDPEVAKLMNEHFICIKVDREEMPHVDQVYMTVTQAMTGSGGWPMTVVMTADRKPFFAGTYYPKPTFIRLVTNIAQAWQDQRQQIVEQAESVTEQLQAIAKGEAGDGLEPELLDTAFATFKDTYDAEHGGFRRGNSFAPKFPAPHDYAFLLRYWKRTGKAEALEIAENTLTKMRLGGVYDHLGYGSHRYATDREWLTPHFEKMLYDQALLAITNLEAYQATQKDFYRRTAEEIFTYVLRDMRSPEGAFYSAEDADSEGEEGKFYVWNLEEVMKVLGEEEGKLFATVFNVTADGNYIEEATKEATGTSILHLAKPLPDVAADLDMDLTALETRLGASRKKLFELREQRVHPFKDDKVLTDWNGLMIAALARAAVVLDKDDYAKAARKAADFVLTKMRNEEGRLVKRYRQGEAGLEAHLEDYAYLSWGLIELYEATFDARYLAEAKTLTEILLEYYWDDNGGGFFTTADDGETLIVRSKEVYDGALPSGNSVATNNLLRLARLTGATAYEDRARDTMKAFSSTIARVPSAFSMMLQALDFMTGDTREIVVVGKPGAEDTEAMLDMIQQRYDPNKVVVFKAVDDDKLAELIPYVKEHKALDDKATAYVCRNFACQLPTNKIDEARALIEGEADKGEGTTDERG